MSEFEEKRLARGNAYRMAFMYVIRRLNIIDFKDVLDVLLMACSVEEITLDDSKKIIEETLENYLKK